jgi:hypothetical protein
MMQAFHVIFQHGLAFRGTSSGITGCVYDVAGEDFLPEGKAAGGTWIMSVHGRCSADYIEALRASIAAILGCAGDLRDIPPFKP